MTHTPFFKAPISIAAAALILAAGLTACKAPSATNTDAPTSQTSEVTPTLAPIRKTLSCLPPEAAMIAAHRATDKRWTDQAENSLTGLKALIEHGTLMAEMGMTDQVLLIAYNPDQAALFERLAPEMLRSNPAKAAKADHAVWLGYNVAKAKTAKTLKSRGNYIIGRIGDPNRQPPLKTLMQAADILVSDNAEKHEGIIGLTRETRSQFEACVAK